jgi:type II secretory pathway component PulC
MKNIAYIIVGILIGFLVQLQLKSPPRDALIKNEEAIEDIQTDKVTKSIFLQEKDKNLKTTEAVKKPVLTAKAIISEPSTKPETDMATTNAPRKLELTFSEEDVAALESNLLDLPYQIKLIPEEEGLRVSYLAENSAFAKVGLKTGDLIRFEILQDLKNTPGPTSQLSNRLVSVINYVR